MMKKTIFLAAALTILSIPSFATAQTTTPAAPAQPAFSTGDTDLGTLLDNPQTKAVLVKYLPGIVKSDQIDMARGMTLRAMQQYAPKELDDATLNKVDADLAKIPASK